MFPEVVLRLKLVTLKMNRVLSFCDPHKRVHHTGGLFLCPPKIFHYLFPLPRTDVHLIPRVTQYYDRVSDVSNVSNISTSISKRAPLLKSYHYSSQLNPSRCSLDPSESSTKFVCPTGVRRVPTPSCPTPVLRHFVRLASSTNLRTVETSRGQTSVLPGTPEIVVTLKISELPLPHPLTPLLEMPRVRTGTLTPSV